MKIYELTYIITPEITIEQAEALAKEIEASLQQKGGVILKYESPLSKVLSYRVKKQSSGFLAILEFQLPEENVKDVKEMLEKDNRILRHMITAKKPLKEQEEKRKRKRPSSVQLEKIRTEYIKNEEPASAQTTAGKEKVELEDIEKKLDEILNE